MKMFYYFILLAVAVAQETKYGPVVYYNYRDATTTEAPKVPHGFYIQEGTPEGATTKDSSIIEGYFIPKTTTTEAPKIRAYYVPEDKDSETTDAPEIHGYIVEEGATTTKAPEIHVYHAVEETTTTEAPKIYGYFVEGEREEEKTTTEAPAVHYYYATDQPTTTRDPWLPEPVPKNDIADVDIDCDVYEESIRVRVRFESGFRGILYTKNHYWNKNCKIHGDGSNEIIFNVPLESCGTTNRVMESEEEHGYKSHMYENVLVIMPEEWGFMDGNDEAFRIKCEFSGQRTRRIHYNLAVPFIQPDELSTVETATVGLPSCWMQIVKGKNPLTFGVDELVLGETATLVVFLHERKYFDLTVSDCYAYDKISSSGEPNTRVELIDDEGCSANGKLAGDPVHDSTLKSGQRAWYFHFRTFKFPDEENVYFQCQCSVCYDHCYKPACSAARYKRSATEQELQDQNQNNETVERLGVYNSVTVVLPENSRYDPMLPKQSTALAQKDPVDNNNICVSKASFAISTAFVASVFFIAVFTVVLTCMKLKTEALRNTKTGCDNIGLSAY